MNWSLKKIVNEFLFSDVETFNGHVPGCKFFNYIFLNFCFSKFTAFFSPFLMLLVLPMCFQVKQNLVAIIE